MQTSFLIDLGFQQNNSANAKKEKKPGNVKKNC